jgi:trimeric autotransporter adhesin
VFNICVLLTTHCEQDMKVVWCPHEGCGHGLLPSAVAASNGRRDSDDVAWRVASSNGQNSNGQSSNRFSFINSSSSSGSSGSGGDSSGSSSSSGLHLIPLDNGANSLHGIKDDAILQIGAVGKLNSVRTSARLTNSDSAAAGCQDSDDSCDRTTRSNGDARSSSSNSISKPRSPKRSSIKAGKQKQKAAAQQLTTAATATANATAAAASATGAKSRAVKPAVPAFAAAAAAAATAATSSTTTNGSTKSSVRNSMIVNERDWVLVDNGRKGSADSCCSDADTTATASASGADSGAATTDTAATVAVTTTAAAVAGPVVECLACGRSVCMLCGK